MNSQTTSSTEGKRIPNCIGVIEKKYEPFKYYSLRFMFWKYRKTNVNGGDALTFPAYDPRYDK